MTKCGFATVLIQRFFKPLLVIAIFSVQYSAYAAAKPDEKGKRNISRIALLVPSANPYALHADARKQTVQFSLPVQIDAENKSRVTVYLRRRGDKQGIAMNDLGVKGDYVPQDNIHGVSVQIDTAKVKPDTCLHYEAYVKQGRVEIVSMPLRLCVSTFPVRVAKPNVDNPVVLEDGVKAVADEVLLYARTTTSAATIRELAGSINARVVGSIIPLNLYQLRLASPVSAKRLLEIVAQLNKRTDIVGAAVNALGEPAGHVDATTDPEFVSQHGVKLVSQHPTLANTYVWDSGAIGTGVTVIVADEGLDRTHPEFGTPGNCQVINNECGPLALNNDNAAAGVLQWHGTRVAGVIAAKAYNLQGIAGVAHGSLIRPYKVASYAVADMDQIFIDAGTYVVSDGASVINASFSGGPWSGVGYAANVTSLCTAVNTAVTSGFGAVAVIAAGNNGADNWYYPARCNQHASVPVANRGRIIAVGNSTSVVTANCGSVGTGQRCAAAVPANPDLLGSNYGVWVDLMAPGSDIRTTRSGGFATSTGTSFATPIVSGAVAILKSCGVALDSIKSRLITGTTATVHYPSSGSPTTTPRLDIHGALSSVNHAPTGVGLSSLGVDENTPTPLEVGTLTAADSDTCDKHTFTIVGGADAGSFNIAGDKLNFNAGVSLNRETKASYSVTVHAVDFFGAPTSPDTTLTISVNDVDEFDVSAVVDVDAAVNSVIENSTGAVGLTASASDADATNNTITYSLIDDAGGRFTIDPVTGVVTAVGAIDREAAATYLIIVRAISTDGSFSDQSFTINIVDVDEFDVGAVTDSNAAGNSVPEIAGVGMPVGLTASASDADATNNTITYSLFDDAGGRFDIDPVTGVVTVAGALDHETGPSHNITVQANGSDGSSSSASFSIAVADVNEAPVANDDTLAATQDTPVIYAAALMLGNDTDVDAATTLVIAGVTSGTGGTAVLNGDGSVTFTPTPGFSGAASFTYTASDGVLSSNVATVTVNVAALPHAPVANNDTLAATEDTPVTYAVAALLGNDTDVDAGTTLAVAGVTSGVGGVVTLNGDGTVTFNPNANFHGPASFSYTATDGGLTSNVATVAVNVAAVNDPATGAPIINGTRTVGQTLTSDIGGIADNDGLGTFHYQWLADGSPVGADSSSYLLTAADFGRFIQLQVSFTDGDGSLETLLSALDAVAVGDPHITAVDGLHYDFQSAGEFVALRGRNGMELQLRMTPVSTATPLTDPNSGLTSGVSVNTGLAARVGDHRVTYQAEGSNAPVLRVDGVVTTLPAGGLDLGGGRLMPQGNGIQIDFPDQTSVTVSSSLWSYYNVWWLHVSVFHTPAYEGIMGARKNGSWLPRLSDGSAFGAMPAAMHDRYVELYVKFADSWRVTDETSLFDYAEGTSTATYTNKAWPTENGPYVADSKPPVKPLPHKEAQRACRGVMGKAAKADCEFDVMVMGHQDVAQGHLQNQKVRLGATQVLVRAVDIRGKRLERVYIATVTRQAVAAKQERRVVFTTIGSVQFMLDGRPLGKPVKLDAKGQAQIKLARLKLGKQTVTARFIPARGSMLLPSISKQAAMPLKLKPLKTAIRDAR